MANQEVQSILADIRAMTAEVRAETAGIREQRKADDKKWAEAEEKIAAQRRAGEAGRDWQVLQQRIDAKQTTTEDILSGVDTSKEARAVRGVISKDVIPKVRSQFAEALQSDELADELAEMRAAQQDLAAAMKPPTSPDERP